MTIDGAIGVLTKSAMPKLQPLTGQRFGHLLVGDRASGGRARWNVTCDCGNSTAKNADHLRRGAVITCGRKCPFFLQVHIRRFVVHGHSGAGLSPEYRVWTGMIQRCTNPRRKAFPSYGGRGILVCQRWLNSFESFLADMGPRPSKTSLDRINNDGNYEPGNCRWATNAEQSRNKRSNKLESHEPDQIRWLSSLGFSYREISQFFEVSRSLIAAVVRREAWR